MDSEQSAELAAVNKHKKFMFIGNKKRYIEVLQCSGEDMNLVLTNGVQVPTSTGLLPTAMAPPVAAPQFIPQRPLISPGGSMIPPVPQTAAPAPYASATAAGMGGLLPYGQMSQMAAYQPSLLAASQAALAAQGALAPPTAAMTHLPPRPAVHPASSAYQPILYWYPSPPVSPQSTYYVHGSPTTVALKGIPFNASLSDVLAFLEGVYEVCIDYQKYKVCFTVLISSLCSDKFHFICFFFICNMIIIIGNAFINFQNFNQKG